MAKNDKYIDGLVRRPRQARMVGIDGIAPKKSSGTKSKKSPAKKAPAKKKNTKSSTRKKIVVEDALRSDIAEEFVQPVGTLDFTGEQEELLEEVAEVNDQPVRKQPETDKDPKPKKKKKWSKKKKTVVGIVTTLVVLIVAVGAVAFIWGDAIISKLTGGKSGFWDIFNVLGEQFVELQKDESGRTNILVFGTSGYDMGGSGHDGAQLTDSVMVISLDQATNDVAMVSLPRDLKVGYTCTATGKINEIYWCHNQYEDDERGGAEALQREIEEILDIKIQYWAHLNWGALVSLVDTLGGITVTLDEDIYDWGWTDVQIDAGVPTTLNGEQALGLARARHGTASGDFTRGASQQKILIAIEEKLKSSDLGLTDIIGVVNSLGDNLRSNFSLEEIKTGAHLLESIDLNNLRQVPLLDTPTGDYMTTANYNGISYVVPVGGAGQYYALQNYIKRMFSSDPAVREEANILVLNGSGQTGVAAAERDRLESDGYTVGAIDDAPDGDYSESYYLYVLNEDLAGTKKALAERYGVTAHSATALPDGIWTEGYDIVIIVGAQS